MRAAVRCMIASACYIGCAVPAATDPTGAGGHPLAGGSSAGEQGGEGPASATGGGEAGGASASTGGASGDGTGGSGGTSSSGGTSGLGGMSGSAGTVPAACGKLPEPALGPPLPVNPSPIVVKSTTVTPVIADSPAFSRTKVHEISAGAGMVSAVERTAGSAKDQVWVWKEPGAFLEYTVRVDKAATYAISVYARAEKAGGVAEVFVNGAKRGALGFPVSSDFPRGHSVMADLAVGVSKIRVAFTASSAPVDVWRIHLNFGGAMLPNAGKVHCLSTSAPVALAPDSPSDFFRTAYDPKQRDWPCLKSFCGLEYLVEAPKDGRYEITMKYSAGGCTGVEFVVAGKSWAVVKFDPGARVTPPKTIELPSGISRLELRNPNYINGEFCGGGSYGEVTLKPLP